MCNYSLISDSSPFLLHQEELKQWLTYALAGGADSYDLSVFTEFLNSEAFISQS
jgi:hypothetical protein